jgi:hypothetical protein
MGVTKVDRQAHKITITYTNKISCKVLCTTVFVNSVLVFFVFCNLQIESRSRLRGQGYEKCIFLWLAKFTSKFCVSICLIHFFESVVCFSFSNGLTYMCLQLAENTFLCKCFFVVFFFAKN